MFFKQYYLDCLSHASYLVGDTTTGRAVVVDPRRDVDEYITDAAANGLQIDLVIETHLHADFLSGHLELSARTGARIGYGAAAKGRVDFDIVTYDDLDVVSLGDVTLIIRETPGHTPESISVIVQEHANDEVPFGVLTGDTLFIGDVGRPDLLVSVGVSADDLARDLYASLHERIMTLPDATRVYPAHGAGSACGKWLSSETVSTIGEQRTDNYALAPMPVEQFVAVVTAGQTQPPNYFAFTANRNRQQRDPNVVDVDVALLTAHEVLAAAEYGATIIDTRDHESFAAGHAIGSVNIGIDGRFADYVGQVVTPDRAVVIVCPPSGIAEAVTRLARIGYDTIVGAHELSDDAANEFGTGWRTARRVTAPELVELQSTTPGVVVLDVRATAEVEQFAIPGSVNIPLNELTRRLDELDPSAPTVVHCAGGYRSSIAASLLRTHGFDDVADLEGGIAAWAAGRTLAQ